MGRKCVDMEQAIGYLYQTRLFCRHHLLHLARCQQHIAISQLPRIFLQPTHSNMAPNLTLFSVNAILILSTDDSTRILAKYYTAPHAPAGTPVGSTTYPGSNPYPSVKDQKAFEKGLLEKTAKQTTDVILYDNRVVVYKQESDVMLVGCLN
jgi:hypothetical protein